MSTSTKAGPSSDRPILELRQICKSFPGVRVLKSVGLRVWPGEVHAFMGENGAGKSTLMKILAGAYRADSGEIILDGKPVQFRTPHEARVAGIGIIYQELTVAPNLTVSGNVFLGSELKRFGFIKDTAEMDRKTQEVLDRLGARFKATERAARLAVAEQQQVEIARPIGCSRWFDNFVRKVWPSSTSAIAWPKSTNWPIGSRSCEMENMSANSSALNFPRIK
jgi:ribose transport system ATP-binding protein